MNFTFIMKTLDYDFNLLNLNHIKFQKLIDIKPTEINQEE